MKTEIETTLLLLENHRLGFDRLIPKKSTARKSVYGKKMKNQDTSDFMKKDEFEKESLKKVDLPVSRVNYGSGRVSTGPLNWKTICSKILSRLDGHRNPIINN